MNKIHPAVLRIRWYDSADRDKMRFHELKQPTPHLEAAMNESVLCLLPDREARSLRAGRSESLIDFDAEYRTLIRRYNLTVSTFTDNVLDYFIDGSHLATCGAIKQFFNEEAEVTSQSETARKFAVHPTAVSKWKSSGRMSERHRIHFSTVYGLTTDDLISLDNRKKGGLLKALNSVRKRDLRAGSASLASDSFECLSFSFASYSLWSRAVADNMADYPTSVRVAAQEVVKLVHCVIPKPWSIENARELLTLLTSWHDAWILCLVALEEVSR